MATNRLTPKQRKFAAEFAKSGNAKKAAVKAGYSKKTARVIGPENLTKPAIADAVEKSVEKITAQAELTAAEVLAEIRKLAFVKLKDAYDKDGNLLNPHDMPEDVAAALHGLESDEIFVGRGSARHKIGETKKVKLADKVKSLEMLAKHFKLLTDVIESKNHSVSVNMTVEEFKAQSKKFKEEFGV